MKPDIKDVNKLTKAQLKAALERRVSLTGSEKRADLVQTARLIGMNVVDISRLRIS